MTKAPISLQDLRRRLYVKAKTESTWRFWGLYVHVRKRETLQQAYRHAGPLFGVPASRISYRHLQSFRPDKSHNPWGEVCRSA